MLRAALQVLPWVIRPRSQEATRKARSLFICGNAAAAQAAAGELLVELGWEVEDMGLPGVV